LIEGKGGSDGVPMLIMAVDVDVDVAVVETDVVAAAVLVVAPIFGS
jgi:hypothetical protein